MKNGPNIPMVECILSALATIVVVCPALATCPDGRAEPCFTYTPPIVNVAPPLSLTPTLGGIAPAPVVQEIPLAIKAEIPLAALARATRQPPTIRERRVELSPSEARELGYLVQRLNEIDTALLQYRKEVGVEYFYNLIDSLLAAIEKRAPNLSSKLEQSLPNIRALMNERRESERQARKILRPGESMSPGQYVEPTRSGDNNYQVYSSVQPAAGAVVAPTPPPACHKEERIHREYRNVLMPNGFDSKGKPLYRNEYHPFPISEMVDVCK